MSCTWQINCSKNIAGEQKWTWNMFVIRKRVLCSGSGYAYLPSISTAPIVHGRYTATTKSSTMRYPSCGGTEGKLHKGCARNLLDCQADLSFTSQTWWLMFYRYLPREHWIRKLLWVIFGKLRNCRNTLVALGVIGDPTHYRLNYFSNGWLGGRTNNINATSLLLSLAL